MMKIVKPCFLLLFLAAMALFMPHARAACVTANLPALLNAPSVSVPASLPVGATIPGTEQTLHVTGSCNDPRDRGKAIISCFVGSGSTRPGLPGVYDSGLAGVGISLMNSSQHRMRGAAGLQCDASGELLGYVSDDAQMTFSFDATLALIKTANTVQSGTLDPSHALFALRADNGDGIGKPNVIRYAGSLALKAATCSVPSTSMVMALGDIPVSVFHGIGTTGPPSSGDISIHCDNAATVTYSVDSSNGFDSSLIGIVKLTQQTGMARGVGVRMSLGGKAVIPNSPLTVGQTPQTGGTLTLPVSLMYYQTQSQVTPGVANSVATVTLTYQ